MKPRLTVAILLAACCALAAAQGTIYESQGKDGPVFSDTPSPGAKPVIVSPPNLTPGVTAPPPAPAAVAAPYYTDLTITVPANEGTIHSNTGSFDVRTQIAPALRRSTGDRLRIKLDGKLLTARYQSAHLHVSSADWNAAANPDDVAHTLQAAIVDRNGKVLLESAAVSFYAHRASARRQHR